MIQFFVVSLHLVKSTTSFEFEIIIIMINTFKILGVAIVISLFSWQNMIMKTCLIAAADNFMHEKCINWEKPTHFFILTWVRWVFVVAINDYYVSLPFRHGKVLNYLFEVLRFSRPNSHCDRRYNTVKTLWFLVQMLFKSNWLRRLILLSLLELPTECSVLH